MVDGGASSSPPLLVKDTEPGASFHIEYMPLTCVYVNANILPKSRKIGG